MHKDDILKQLLAPDGVVDEVPQLARKFFWRYCQYINPRFFSDDKDYIRDLCDALQGIFEGTLINPVTGRPYKKIMINMPPRHGKSYTLTLFCQWALGRENETRIISVSYNDILAGRFARTVRDGIDATTIDTSYKVFADVFPVTKIKHGDASYQLWSLEGQHFNYLATGFGGTITGIGCNIGIIDDPIKNNEEAFNDAALDAQWDWYANTFLSRVEAGGIEVIVMTRWSTRDLCGRILDSEDADAWFVYERQACTDEDAGTMLCSNILSFEEYQRRRKLTSPEIADANYQQKPVDIKGKLYTSFSLYDDIPRDIEGKPRFSRIIAYIDTADEGADFLFAGVAGEWEGEGWMLDVLYTDAPMEQTEPDTAELLITNNVRLAKIESNNGGRGFARNVERILWETFQTRSIEIEWFHQGSNKKARILSGASYVMNHIHMPADWARRWPAYYAAMQSYQRKGRNAHDDAPDGTTGIAEMLQDNEQKELRMWVI